MAGKTVADGWMALLQAQEIGKMTNGAELLDQILGGEWRFDLTQGNFDFSGGPGDVFDEIFFEEGKGGCKHQIDLPRPSYG